MYDQSVIREIVDATPFCHLGYTRDDQPVVIPTIHARMGDHLVVHGSIASRVGLQAAREPTQVCVTVTLIDGFVLARSGFNHSVNHRSVVVLGNAELLRGHRERLTALRALTNHVAPGRWEELRPPTSKELDATAVIRLPLTEASAKIRTGPPNDPPEDLQQNTWAGTIPIHRTYGDPRPAPDLDERVSQPPSVRRLVSKARHPTAGHSPRPRPPDEDEPGTAPSR